MKAVLQRVSSAGVVIDSNEERTIGPGLMVLAGFCEGDNEETVRFMAEKIVNLRIFSDENDLMNRSLLDIGGELLLISNFTLYANCRKGRRPSFVDAARPEQSIPLYEYLIGAFKSSGLTVKTGEFGADMQVTLTNDGPVTIILDSQEVLPATKGGTAK